jgi:hypothetical protein
MKTLPRQPAVGFARYADVPDTYTALCRLHLPRPIRNAAEQRAASGVVAWLSTRMGEWSLRTRR